MFWERCKAMSFTPAGTFWARTISSWESSCRLLCFQPGHGECDCSRPGPLALTTSWLFVLHRSLVSRSHYHLSVKSLVTFRVTHCHKATYPTVVVLWSSLFHLVGERELAEFGCVVAQFHSVKGTHDVSTAHNETLKSYLGFLSPRWGLKMMEYRCPLNHSRLYY